ncbi:MAG: BrnT family toxin [Pseudomonadota bacterium]
MCSFEFHQTKSLANLEKHRIDFIEAQAIWKDPDLIEIQAKSHDGIRAFIIGMIHHKHWSAIITYRNEKI